MYGVLDMLFSSGQPVGSTCGAVKTYSSKFCTQKSVWSGHEDLLKWAFVQLGTGTALLLYITLKRGLRDLSYDRETQRRSSTKRSNPGQRCCLVEIAKNPDFASFLHNSSLLGPELSPPICKSFTGMLK